MSLTALLYILIFLGFAFLALFKEPFWALLLYIHVYFNMPSHQFWHNEVPDLRWSLISLIIILMSCLLHKDRLAARPVFQSGISIQLILLYFLILATGQFSLFPDVVSEKTHLFTGYMIAFFIILKVVRSFDQLIIILGWIILETFQLARLAHGRYHGGRLEGIGLPDASSANLFGDFIAMVLPLFIPFLFAKNKKIKLTAIILAPFVVNAFVMCGSRGAFVGVLVAAFVVLYFVYTQHINVINKKAVLAYLLIAVSGFWLLLSPDYKARLYTLTEEQSPEDISSGRTAIWSHGLKMVTDYPFGAGPGGFMALSPQYIPEQFIERETGHRAAHNTYLLILVEQGYLGLFLYLSLIISVYHKFSQAWRFIKNGSLKLYKNKYKIELEYLHIAFLASFSSFAVTAFFASRLYYEFFYIFLALIVVYFYLVNDAFVLINGKLK